MWNAVESFYFVHRSYIALVLGDMLRLAKLSEIAGLSAHYGDRFSTVKGAKAGSDGSKAKPQYYPIFNHEIIKVYNHDRPSYNIDNLPMHTDSEYWNTIA